MTVVRLPAIRDIIHPDDGGCWRGVVVPAPVSVVFVLGVFG